MSTCYSNCNVQEVWCMVLDFLNHGWLLYARPFVALPPFKALFFFLLESADTAVLYCCTVYGFAVFYPNSSSTKIK